MAKFTAKGVVVKSGSAASPTQTLPGVKSVSVNTGSRDMIDVTTHDSTTTKEYLPAALRDTVSLELELVFDPTSTYHDELVDAKAAGTKWYLSVILPDSGSATWALSGYFTDQSVPTLDPETGALMTTFSFKCDVADTYTQ